MRIIVALGLAWAIVVGAASGCSSTPVSADAAVSDAAVSDAVVSDAVVSDAAVSDAAADAASSSVCSTIICSADPAPTDASKQACEAELKGACAAEYSALSNCVWPKVTCGPDSKTDQASLTKALTDCARQVRAYQDCKAKNADGGP